MSKFKPGAVVFLKGFDGMNHFCAPYVGTVQTLGAKTYFGPLGDLWLFDPPVLAADGNQCAWTEKLMILIDPGEGTDEVLLITGLPETKVLETQP